ncbi:MAG: polysaccharide biosynthesis protein [Clostridiaceae bacterium]|nr:polysaccharide biosynthesis protein [Clostridiaceae bacterium]
MRKQSISKGFAVLSVAGIAVKILSILYIPFLRWIIGDEGYGIYGAAYQVYVFIYVIANSGIPVAISKSVSELVALENYKDAARVFKIARAYLIIIGVTLSVAMFAASGPLAGLVRFDKSFLAIAALSPTILFTSIGSAYRGYFQGRGNMTPTAVSQIVEQIVNVICTLLFAYLLIGRGIEAACAGGTVGTSMGALVSTAFLIYIFNKNRNTIVPEESRKKNINRFTYRQLAVKVLDYSIPITVCLAAQYAGNLVDLANTKARLLTAGFSDANASIMYGYLTKYQQLMNVPISFVSALAAAVLPSLSGSMALRDREQTQHKIRYSVRLCFLLVIPSAVGFSVLSEPVYSLLKFGAGSYLMLYGSVVLVLMAVVQIQTTILQGAGKLYRATVNVLIGIAAKVLLNYVLIAIPQLNINGAIIGSAAGFIIPLILNTAAIRKYVGVRTDMAKQVSKPLISSIVMGLAVLIVYKTVNVVVGLSGALYFSNALAVVLSVISGMLVYLMVMLKLKGINEEDLDALPERFKRIIPKKFLNRMV